MFSCLQSIEKLNFYYLIVHILSISFVFFYFILFSLLSIFYRYSVRLVFMGDDTWTSLFPTQFDVNLPFDSFNTKVLQHWKFLLIVEIVAIVETINCIFWQFGCKLIYRVFHFYVIFYFISLWKLAHRLLHFILFCVKGYHR